MKPLKAPMGLREGFPDTAQVIQYGDTAMQEKQNAPGNLWITDDPAHALRRGQAQPAIGSARDAHALNLPGLRSWSLTRYPYLVFYIERDDHIDVWRAWHGQREIPVWLANDSDPENLH